MFTVIAYVRDSYIVVKYKWNLLEFVMNCNIIQEYDKFSTYFIINVINNIIQFSIKCKHDKRNIKFLAVSDSLMMH